MSDECEVRVRKRSEAAAAVTPASAYAMRTANVTDTSPVQKVNTVPPIEVRGGSSKSARGSG